MYQDFIGFSRFLKNSGTLWSMSLLGVPEFHRFPLIFWNNLVHFGEGDSYVYQIFIGFSGSLKKFWYT